MMAAVGEEDRIDTLLDRFQACSEKIVRAWMQTTAEVMLTHDDIAMTTGTILSPGWLRKHVIARYPNIWAPVKAKGIPHFFFSDGDWSAVAEDLCAAGAGGFYVDTPFLTLDRAVQLCGRDKIYICGIPPAVMQTGSPQQVRDAVAKLADLGRSLPKYFFFNWYTPEMPTANVAAYYDACRRYGQRAGLP